MLRCSASIVAFKNRPEQILAAAQSYLRAAGKEALLYIVDHSPVDELREVFENRAYTIYVHNPKNPGFGAGHNFALRKTIDQFDLHLVLNPDVYFKPDIWAPMIHYMYEHPEVGHLMPRILNPQGETQYLAKLIPSPLDLLFKRFLPSSLTKKRLKRFRLEDSGYSKIMNVPYLSGCFMLLRTQAIRDCGMFDERFFMYPDDIDLTRRIHRKYKTIYFPYVSVVHQHEAASYKSRKMLWIHSYNMIKYFNKWGWFFDSERQEINRKVETEIFFKILKFFLIFNISFLLLILNTIRNFA